MKTGVELIATERRRQIDREGWHAVHDDEHDEYEMSMAAMCYVHVAILMDAGSTARKARKFVLEQSDFAKWPWHREYFKARSELRNMVRAGALIAAEIDRLQRRDSPGKIKPKKRKGAK